MDGVGGVEACGTEDVAEFVTGWVEAIIIIAAAAAIVFSSTSEGGAKGVERDSGEVDTEIGSGGGGGGSSSIAAWRRSRLANAFEREGSFGLGTLAASATMRGVSSRGVCRPMEGGGGGRL